MTVVPEVDRAVCSGAGMCAVYAPRTFALDGEARSTVIEPDGDCADDVAAAVEACPTGAISLVPAPVPHPPRNGNDR